MTIPTNIPAPRVPFTDPRTGQISREWYRYQFNQFESLKNLASISDSETPIFVSANRTLDEANRNIIATATGLTLTLPKAALALVGLDLAVSLGAAGTLTVTTQGGDTFPAPSSATETSVIYTQRGESYIFRCVSDTRWRIE